MITASSVYLSWDALTSLTDTSYAAIIDYKVLWNSGGTGSTFTDKISQVNGLGVQVTGLTAGQTYKFKVQARNKHGLGPESSEI